MNAIEQDVVNYTLFYKVLNLLHIAGGNSLCRPRTAPKVLDHFYCQLGN